MGLAGIQSCTRLLHPPVTCELKIAALMSRVVKDCLRVALFGGTRFLVIAGLSAFVVASAILLVLRFVDPPMSALMARQSLSGQPIKHQWSELETISPNLIRAVVNSEDARFCQHGGIDRIELSRAIEAAKDRGDLAVRGASTISMQVVKNMFLWPEQTYLRKGLEFLITPLMELIWPKSRILEVYLNIAEWAPGVFGAEAAARHHFKKRARRITRREAALLAAALPNPIARRAGRPGPQTRRLARRKQTRVRRSRTDLSCLNLRK